MTESEEALKAYAVQVRQAIDDLLVNAGNVPIRFDALSAVLIQASVLRDALKERFER